MKKSDSHIPNDSGISKSDPMPQSHRNARGLPVDGMTNPNGADSGPKDNKIANGCGKTY